MKQPNQRKCVSCKEVFTKRHFNQKYCFNPSCVAEWTAKEKSKQWTKEKSKKKEELLTVQDHLKLTQAIFNKYIRERDKKLGNPCMSCRKPLVGKFDAGHFWNANNHWNLRFDERNVHSQCVHCNRDKHGNLLEYRKQLEIYFGERWLGELEQDAQKTRKFTREELIEIRELYKQKTKDLI